ncbi:MAG: class I SAM-dependent methyltransferase [Vicinamibacterales bacterium]
MASGSRERASLCNISDTARWVAAHRAIETARPDAIFRDPLAARLAGESGQALAETLHGRQQASWPFVVRTYLIDRMISAQVTAGVDLVINIAAGLDTRPYRMALPKSLTWVEVDLPDLLSHKVEKLLGERPACKLDRVACDLTDKASRRELFAKLNARARNVLVITEGLLIYSSDAEVTSLAGDLAWASAFRHWITDLVSPALLERLQRAFGRTLVDAKAPLKFGPPAGVTFFEPLGWKAVEVHSMLKTAATLKRLPWYLKPYTLFRDKQPPGRAMWSGVCLMERI